MCEVFYGKPVELAQYIYVSFVCGFLWLFLASRSPHNWNRVKPIYTNICNVQNNQRPPEKYPHNFTDEEVWQSSTQRGESCESRRGDQDSGYTIRWSQLNDKVFHPTPTQKKNYVYARVRLLSSHTNTHTHARDSTSAQYVKPRGARAIISCRLAADDRSRAVCRGAMWRNLLGHSQKMFAALMLVYIYIPLCDVV